MKAQFLETLSDGTQNPEAVCAKRALDVITREGRIDANTMRERCGGVPVEILVPALLKLVQAGDILRIDEKGSVFLEPAFVDRDSEPKAVRLVLECLVFCGVTDCDTQPRYASFGPIVKRVTVPEIDEAVAWLIENRVILRGKPQSSFVAGVRWKEMAGHMRRTNISVFGLA